MTDQTATPDFQGSKPKTSMDRLYQVSLWLAVLIVVARGFGVLLGGTNVYENVGNDNIMRLMSTRDWLAGQAWFDMAQYRMQPDEGLSLHWSRYVDLGIGTVFSFFALFMPMLMAEQIGGVVWPAGLLIALILFTGQTTLRVLGPVAASVAVLMVVCYPPLAQGYFGPGRLDHHNVQILLMTVAALSFARVDRTLLWGTVAGLSSAMSLAIGLEALFMVATVSLLLVINAAFGGAATRQRLLAYCIAIFAGALTFFAGQTPPAEWLVNHCDELAPPILALTAVGATAGLSGLLVTTRMRGPLPFMGAVAGTTVAGFALAWPVLSPCLQAPYANLSTEAQDFIANSILEARSMAGSFKVNSLAAGAQFGAPIAVLLLAIGTWWRQQDRPKVVGYFILIGMIGFAASLWQVRQVVILATVTPILAGYVVAPILSWRLAERSNRSQLALFGVAGLTLFQPALLVSAFNTTNAVKAYWQGDADNTPDKPRWLDVACNDTSQMVALNTIPATAVLTGINLGPRLIMHTHHTGLAAPYHRSEAMLTNAFAYEIKDAAAFDARLETIGASVFVVCKGSHYGDADSIGSRLAAGDQITGFDKIDLGTADVMAFQRTGL